MARLPQKILIRDGEELVYYDFMLCGGEYVDPPWRIVEQSLGWYKTWDWCAMALGTRPQLDVNQATEHNSHFLDALAEAVEMYPELQDFTVHFDGPPYTVEELLVERPDQQALSDLVFYHGTSTWALDFIKDGGQGLRPRSETEAPYTYGAGVPGAKEGDPNAVYLTTQMNTARAAAREASYVHSRVEDEFGDLVLADPVILAVTDLHEGRLRPDEDSRKTSMSESLATLGSVKHIGAIPPHKIEVLSAGPLPPLRNPGGHCKHPRPWKFGT